MLITKEPKKRKIFLLMTIILTVGVLLRVVYLVNHANINNDIARDLLMGRHIARFDEIPKLGQITSIPRLSLSPYYFYFLGLLTKIQDNYFFISSVIFLMNVFSLFLLFLAIKNLFNEKVAILTMLFYVFFLKTTETVDIWSVYVIQSFFFMGIYFFSSYYKEKKLHLLFLSTAFFSFASFSALEYLYLMPFFFIWSVYLGLGSQKNKETEFIKILSFWLFSFIAGALPIIIFYKDTIYKRIGGEISLNIFANLTNNLNTLFFYIYNDSLRIKVAVFFIILFIVVEAIRSFKLKNVNQNEVFIFLIFLGGLFISALESNILNYQLIALWPFFFLILAVLITQTLRNNVLILLMITLFLFLEADTSYLKFIFTYDNAAHQVQKIAAKINNDLMSSNIDSKDFAIVSIGSDRQYEELPYYYFLENEKPILTIKDGQLSSFQLIDNNRKKIVYLICENYTNCLDQYQIEQKYVVKTELFYFEYKIMAFKIYLN